MVDQMATASVCNLRFRGILVGTKLCNTANINHVFFDKGQTLNSMDEWRATTGRNGVAVRLDNFPRNEALNAREEWLESAPSISP